MGKYTDVDVKKIEEYWSNIEQLRKDLKHREYDLLYPFQETDENLGGGKSNTISDITAQKAIVLASDRNYQNLKNIITTIDELYPLLDKDQKTIIEMRYWNKRDCFEWVHIADALFMSVQRVLRKRNHIIDETAQRLGWV